MQVTKKEDLTLETVLSKVSEYQIFRWFIGKDFKLGQPFRSPLRVDKNPSFSIIATRSGKLYFSDFANSDHKGNVIDFVQIMFSLNYGQALAKIDQEMGLGIMSPKSTYKAVIATFDEPKIEKQETLIQVKSKPFDGSDLAYWNQYHIDSKELKANNVYSVKRLYINRTMYPFNPLELCFGYLLGEYWKIYWPNLPKKDKWKANVPIDLMWGIDEVVPGTELTVVTKSLKDRMVLKKFLPVVPAAQNESPGAINDVNIQLLQSNSKRTIINFDSDEAGQKNSKHFNQYGFGWINVPNHYTVKDFADLAKIYGMDAVINHFRLKGLI